MYPEARQNLNTPIEFDNNTFFDALILYKGSLGVADPANFVQNVQTWFRINRRQIVQFAKMYGLEYNPIENYDRTEETTINGSSTTNGSNINKERAYDTEDMHDVNRSESGMSGESESTTRSRVHGNIGVTTSAQMITAERKLWTNANLYKDVVDMFSRDLLICIYPDRRPCDVFPMYKAY